MTQGDRVTAERFVLEPLSLDIERVEFTVASLVELMCRELPAMQTRRQRGISGKKPCKYGFEGKYPRIHNAPGIVWSRAAYRMDHEGVLLPQ